MDLPLDTIVCGDNATVMAGWPEGCIDLICTSPPYNCGMDYGPVDDQLPWGAYWEAAGRWLAESLRVLRPGGRLVVNLPWWMGSKPRRDVPHAFKCLALSLGYLFLDKILWIKGGEANVHTSGGYGGGGCGWGTYLSPSGPSIRCASEPILVFSRGSRGRGEVSGEGRGACRRGDLTPAEWLAWTVDCWFLRGAADKQHPAVWPVEIPWRLIRLYCFPDEVVLDPFMGSGRTAQAARRAGRRWIGIEANPQFCELARGRLAQRSLDL